MSTKIPRPGMRPVFPGFQFAALVQSGRRSCRCALRLNGCAPIPKLRRVPHDAIAPNPWMILPFALLLGLIALAPLLFGEWWLKHYQKVALGLGAVTLGYYFFGLHAYEHLMGILQGTHLTSESSALGEHAYTRLVETAKDYVKFIALIGSLSSCRAASTSRSRAKRHRW